MKVAAEPAEEGRAVRIPFQVSEELVRVAQSYLEKASLLPGIDFVWLSKRSFPLEGCGKQKE